jgi:hypothetical protein
MSALNIRRERAEQKRIRKNAQRIHKQRMDARRLLERRVTVSIENGGMHLSIPRMGIACGGELCAQLRALRMATS